MSGHAAEGKYCISWNIMLYDLESKGRKILESLSLETKKNPGWEKKKNERLYAENARVHTEWPP